MNDEEKSQIPPFYKRKYLVNKSFQFSFIGRILLVNLLLVGGLYLLNYVVFYRFNFLGNELGFESGHKFYDFVEEQILWLSAIFVGFSLISSLAIVLYGIFLSHRIVGPLENIKLRFKEIEKAVSQSKLNEVPKAKFREKDFFKELEEAYNEHLLQLQKSQHQKLSVVETENTSTPSKNKKDNAA